jgi:lipopolysaccharide assembly protein A
VLPRSQELERVEEGSQREDLSMQSFLIVALGLAILTVIFALQNTIPVGVTFLIWKFEGSLALVLMLTFALGVLVSFLVSIPAIVKRRSAISNQMKKIEELENRLRERTPPFA